MCMRDRRKVQCSTYAPQNALSFFQSTRLGKHINQVRRNISDKTLAKRMKRLVIQWRSLAQKAPSTPNGVPGGSPPSLAIPTSSPPASVTTTISTPAQNSPPQPPIATPLTDLSTLSIPPLSPSSALPPPSRPPSKYPPSHRKRLIQRLSTVKSLSNTSQSPAQSTPQPPQVLTLTSTQPPSPPLVNSSQNHTATHIPSPQPPPLLASTVSSPVLTQPTPLSSTSLSSPPSSSPAAILVETAVPSLPVSLPLNSVVQDLVVRIPLVHLKPSKTLGVTQAAGTTPIVGHTEREKERERDQKIPEKKSRALIVSVSRLLLDRHLQSSPLLSESSMFGGGTYSTLPVQEGDQDSPPQLQDLPPCSMSPQRRTLSPCQSPGQVCVPNGHCPGVHGCYGSDGLWYGWTEPILGKDFAVNVLPYVYIDGLDETDQT